MYSQLDGKVLFANTYFGLGEFQFKKGEQEEFQRNCIKDEQKNTLIQVPFLTKPDYLFVMRLYRSIFYDKLFLEYARTQDYELNPSFLIFNIEDLNFLELVEEFSTKEITKDLVEKVNSTKFKSPKLSNLLFESNLELRRRLNVQKKEVM